MPEPCVHAVVNELSFATVPKTGASDAELLRGFTRTICAMRAAVAVHDERNVVLVSPDRMGAMSLPGGTRLSAARGMLDDDLATFLLELLTNGPWFADDGTTDSAPPALLQWLGVNAPGLSVALARDGLALSLATPPWQQAILCTPQLSGAVHAHVVNGWQPALETEHLQAIDRRVPVLPQYENPGHHDPTHPAYDQRKSQIPRGAALLLRYAIPTDESRLTWWARCHHRFFHRFNGQVRGTRVVVHWNGTTSQAATQVTPIDLVPVKVKRRLLDLEPAQICECRQV